MSEELILNLNKRPRLEKNIHDIQLILNFNMITSTNTNTNIKYDMKSINSNHIKLNTNKFKLYSEFNDMILFIKKK